MSGSAWRYVISYSYVNMPLPSEKYNKKQNYGKENKEKKMLKDDFMWLYMIEEANRRSI